MTMNRRGLSLMEILIAVAILAVATLALVSVQTYSLRAQKKTAGKQAATSLAVSVMNDIEAFVKDDFEGDILTDLVVDTSTWPEGYTYRLAQSYEQPNLQRVEVVIQWQDQNGEQEYQLWTKLLKDD